MTNAVVTGMVRCVLAVIIIVIDLIAFMIVRADHQNMVMIRFANHHVVTETRIKNGGQENGEQEPDQGLRQTWHAAIVPVLPHHPISMPHSAFFSTDNADPETTTHSATAGVTWRFK